MLSLLCGLAPFPSPAPPEAPAPRLSRGPRSRGQRPGSGRGDFWPPQPAKQADLGHARLYCERQFLAWPHAAICRKGRGAHRPPQLRPAGLAPPLRQGQARPGEQLRGLENRLSHTHSLCLDVYKPHSSPSTPSGRLLVCRATHRRLSRTQASALAFSGPPELLSLLTTRLHVCVAKGGGFGRVHGVLSPPSGWHTAYSSPCSPLGSRPARRLHLWPFPGPPVSGVTPCRPLSRAPVTQRPAFMTRPSVCRSTAPLFMRPSSTSAYPSPTGGRRGGSTLSAEERGRHRCSRAGLGWTCCQSSCVNTEQSDRWTACARQSRVPPPPPRGDPEPSVGPGSRWAGEVGRRRACPSPGGRLQAEARVPLPIRP